MYEYRNQIINLIVEYYQDIIRYIIVVFEGFESHIQFVSHLEGAKVLQFRIFKYVLICRWQINGLSIYGISIIYLKRLLKRALKTH